MQVILGAIFAFLIFMALVTFIAYCFHKVDKNEWPDWLGIGLSFAVPMAALTGFLLWVAS